MTILTHAYTEHCGVTHLTGGLKVYYARRQAIYQSTTLPTFFGAFPLLYNILIKEKVNILHAHQAFSTMAHEAVLHARTMGLKVVFTDHSLFGFADPASILVNKVLKFTLADVHRVICVSHTSKENTVLRACIPPERVSVIPNAVDASQFTPDPQQRRTDGVITIVCLSRLVYRKGIDLLAAALPVLCQRHHDIEFLIGGDGPKSNLLKKIIDENQLYNRVHLLGALPHERVRSLLVRGHIFLNCSLTEAFCMALVEAAAAGLLVVSTSVGGVPEVLPPEMLVQAEPSTFGIITAIDTALKKVSKIDAWELHMAAKKMYSWNDVAKRTERAYLDVVSSRRDDSMLARLTRYHKCGKWFGKICCCVVAVDWLYWNWLTWQCTAKTKNW